MNSLKISFDFDGCLADNRGLDNVEDSVMFDLESVANFEWLDTKNNFSNGEEVMSLLDFYNLAVSISRDKKIDDILN